MSRLPNVNKLVAQITAKAEAVKTEKLAAEQTAPTYTVPVAEGIYKLAQQLRERGGVAVSYVDVREFAHQLMEQTNV